MRVRARHAAPGSPGDTEERRGDAGAGFVRDGLAGSNRILFLLRVAVVSPSDGGRVRGKAGARAAVAANPGEVYTDWPLASLCAPPSPDANFALTLLVRVAPVFVDTPAVRRRRAEQHGQFGAPVLPVPDYPGDHARTRRLCRWSQL